MFRMKATTNAEGIQQQMQDFAQRQVPFATARALTETAKLVAQKDIKKLIKRKFHKPVPFTQNSPAFLPASKNRLRSVVFIKDRPTGERKGAAAEYLKWQETGGRRTPFNSANYATKQALTIPEEIDMNAYDNMTKKAIPRILRRKDTFVSKRGSHLKPGIYQRLPDGNLKLLVSFVQSATYREIFDFRDAGMKAARGRFPNLWTKYYVDALNNPRFRSRRGRRILR